MNFNEDLFQKVKEKTSVSKDTILSLANKLNNGKMKDEKTLREVISTLESLTGKSLSDQKKDKIIQTIVKDKVPKNIDKMF